MSNTNHTINHIATIADLSPTEEIQDASVIHEIQTAIGTDAEVIAWDEIPALIIDEENNILDGHHRAEAVKETVGVWRALVVDRGEWDAYVDQHGFSAACRYAADLYDDHVTWGAI